MTRLVDARKAEVAILAHLTILGTVYNQSFVSCGVELLAVRVLNGKTDSLSAKPIA